MENVFNIWKKFDRAKLKRSLLCETLTILLDKVERRLTSDVIMLTPDRKKEFIDMREIDNQEGRCAHGAKEAQRRHQKKLSTYQLFSKERAKMQNPHMCPWSSAIHVPTTRMWLVQVN